MNLLWDGLGQAIKLIFSGDSVVYAAAWRSLWISSGAVLFAAIIGVPLGTWLAERRTVTRRIILAVARAGINLPTVLIGLICYALFFSQGPLGFLGLLFTPWLILVGEFLLALPIVTSLTHAAVGGLDPRVGETATTLGATRLRRQVTYLSEARTGIVLAMVTAFARCVTELGVAVLVGGNLSRQTRTLATATAMETGKGEFARGIAMGGMLLVISLFVALLISFLSREELGRSTA